MIRDCEPFKYTETELNIGGKNIFKSQIKLQEGDVFVAMSDGCPHAGIGTAFNFGWKRDDIADFMSGLVPVGYTAKTLSTMLVDECDKLYGGHPGDDATACVVKIRKREPMNLLFGPPRNPDDCDRMMSLFFSKEGNHIICGGYYASDIRPSPAIQRFGVRASTSSAAAQLRPSPPNIWASRSRRASILNRATFRRLRRSRALIW